MTDESDDESGLDDLAEAARSQAHSHSRIPPTRHRIPSMRILQAGGFVLRLSGAFLVMSGIIWMIVGIIEMSRLDGPPRESTLSIANEAITFHPQGWTAVIACFIFAIVLWLNAIVTLAMGHALYAVRDIWLRR